MIRPTNPPRPPATPLLPLAPFRAREPDNGRLALDLITDPSQPYAPDADLAPMFDPLVQQSAVLVVDLARAAQTSAIQLRLMRDVGVPALDVSRCRLQGASAVIARRLLLALSVAFADGRSARPWLDVVRSGADRCVADAGEREDRGTETLPTAVAEALTRALALDRSERDRAVPHVAGAAASAVALFVLAGLPPGPSR